MCIITDGSEKGLPEGAREISFNGVSRVWLANSYVYKRSTPFLTNNEFYFLKLMEDSGYSPTLVSKIDKYTIRMEYLGRSQKVTDDYIFSGHMYELYTILQEKGIRHGDLTRYAIVVKSNKPYLIDFAESRRADDPRPDKRVEGDRYWLERTIDELTEGL